MRAVTFMRHIKAFISRIQEVYIENPFGLCEYSIPKSVTMNFDRLCGPVVRVPGYRSRGLGFDSQRYQIL
jgi:hypothetical protein